MSRSAAGPSRADLQLDPLTADDFFELDFVAQHADLIGFSFVQSLRRSQAG